MITLRTIAAAIGTMVATTAATSDPLPVVKHGSCPSG